jgi:hypothetical protein
MAPMSMWNIEFRVYGDCTVLLRFFPDSPGIPMGVDEPQYWFFKSDDPKAAEVSGTLVHRNICPFDEDKKPLKTGFVGRIPYNISGTDLLNQAEPAMKELGRWVQGQRSTPSQTTGYDCTAGPAIEVMQKFVTILRDQALIEVDENYEAGVPI